MNSTKYEAVQRTAVLENNTSSGIYPYYILNVAFGPIYLFGSDGGEVVM